MTNIENHKKALAWLVSQGWEYNTKDNTSVIFQLPFMVYKGNEYYKINYLSAQIAFPEQIGGLFLDVTLLDEGGHKASPYLRTRYYTVDGVQDYWVEQLAKIEKIKPGAGKLLSNSIQAKDVATILNL